MDDRQRRAWLEEVSGRLEAKAARDETREPEEDAADEGGGAVQVLERKNRGGRKSLLTPAVQERIVTAIREVGLHYVGACQLAGIDESTALQWRQRGEGRHPQRPATPELVAFVEEVKKAEAQCEAEALAVIKQAGQGGAVLSERRYFDRNGYEVVERRYSAPEWQARAWFLERTRPDQYGRRERLDMRRMMEEVAKKVADESGVQVEELLQEAQRLVAEG